MTEWYIPVTLLPGVGLLIMSTSNLLNAISSELSLLIRECDPLLNNVVERKINQVELLNKSLVNLYVSSACYVLAGLTGTLVSSSPQVFETLQFGLMLLGTLTVLIALILLTLFSYHAVSIKKEQFRLRLTEKNKKSLKHVEAKEPEKI